MAAKGTTMDNKMPPKPGEGAQGVGGPMASAKAEAKIGEPPVSAGGQPVEVDPDKPIDPSEVKPNPDASATNPALVANNAMPVAPTQPDPKDVAKAKAEGMVPTPLHGSGTQPHVG